MARLQLTPRQLVGFVRLRYKMLLIPPVIVTSLCAVVAFMLPRSYESSIRILVQRADVVNPLANLANALNQSDDSPLRLFGEIIYSEHTYQLMMDSLGLSSEVHNEADRRMMMVRVRSSIQSNVTYTGESFTVGYQDSDPRRAQRGAAALANIFIGTVSDAKNQKNQLTVDFYEKKLDEFRLKMDENQNLIMSKMKRLTGGTVGTNALLYLRLDQVTQRIKETGDRVAEYQRVQSSLQSLGPNLSAKEARETLFEVQRADAPYAADLRPLLSTYEDVLARYTSQHPEVAKAETRIREVVERINVGIKSEITKKKSEMDDLQKGKSVLIDDLMKSSGVQKSDDGLESTYLLYQKLYSEMRMKLEEAQINRTLGANLQSQYTVMDPAYLPMYPSKPSRSKIIGAGLGLGVLLGLISALIAEMLDTTIRSARSVEIYGKPVIAFLPEGKEVKELKD